MVRAWAERLAPGAAVLDLGCGSGVPVTEVLLDAGLRVYAVDASPQMISAFARNFPDVPIACEDVETSSFFGRRFDAAVAWGLLFLLPERSQVATIDRVAAVLKPGAQFLFTAPRERCTWADVLTGELSLSLGAETYVAVLERAGFRLDAECEDEGGNHYYVAVRSAQADVRHGNSLEAT